MKTAAPRFQMIEPRPESVAHRDGLRFRWEPMGNVAHYELRVVNSEGDLLWESEASEPSAQLPPDVSLRPGQYFVWVEAYLKDGRIVKSNTVHFAIRNSS
jgi:hypothetical protein